MQTVSKELTVYVSTKLVTTLNQGRLKSKWARNRIDNVRKLFTAHSKRIDK